MYRVFRTLKICHPHAWNPGSSELVFFKLLPCFYEVNNIENSILTEQNVYYGKEVDAEGEIWEKCIVE